MSQFPTYYRYTKQPEGFWMKTSGPLELLFSHWCFIVHNGNQKCAFCCWLPVFCLEKKEKRKSILSGNIPVSPRMFPTVPWLFWLLLYQKSSFLKRGSYNCLSGKPAEPRGANQLHNCRYRRSNPVKVGQINIIIIKKCSNDWHFQSIPENDTQHSDWLLKYKEWNIKKKERGRERERDCSVSL